MTSSEPGYPLVQFASDHSILVTFGDVISRDLHHKVFQFFQLLSSVHLDGLINIHPAYSSVLVSFDPKRIRVHDVQNAIGELLNRSDTVAISERPIIEIPTCYDAEYALDIVDVAAQNKLAIEEVTPRHSSTDYLVYFLGFSPGFAYLGELPIELVTPRLTSPRVKVPAGSVAIGGSQTGIYPVASPGGWRIIGRTPRRMFLPEKYPPTLLQMGDTVRFIPITKSEFQRILEY